MSAPDSLFVRAAKAQPTERTPFWFMRQAGRYMAEYRAIRKQYSLIEICKRPAIFRRASLALFPREVQHAQQCCPGRD